MVASNDATHQPSGAARWKVSAVAAALGALVSLALGLLTALTGFGLIVGLVGAPVGVVLGFLFGPRLLREPRTAPLSFSAAVLAVPMGAGFVAFGQAVAQSAGASPLELVIYTFQWAAIFSLFAAMWGGPMALVSALVSAWALRRLASRIHLLWPAALVVIALVTAGSAVTLGMAVARAGDEAAMLGDRVSFEYLVDDAGDRDYAAGYTLEVRSYWRGELAGGSGSGGIGPCSSGTDSVQSDWVVWIGSDRDGSWHERPPVPPLVSAADYGPGPVRLTITIAPDGTASWERGIHGGGC